MSKKPSRQDTRTAKPNLPVAPATLPRVPSSAPTTSPVQLPAGATELAHTTRQIARACEVDRPLGSGDPRWLDFSPARGDRATRNLLRRFEDKPAEQTLQLLLASHRGAGKTTELMVIQERLRPRYQSLYLEANVQMDANQIEVEDLFLILAQGIERHLSEAGTPLPKELLDHVSAWFDQVIKTTSWGKDSSVQTSMAVKAETGIPLFAKLTATLTGLFKAESKHREEVKNELKKFPGSLLESVNQLLDAAKEVLAKQGKELLIIIDNLDRYDPAVIDSLLVRNGDRIRQLRCNFILTPPIGLLYRPHSEQIDTHFPCEVMNTVRLRRPEQPYDAFDGPGHDLLLDALKKRLDLDALIPDLRARDRLVTASGGAIRDLLSLVVDAALITDNNQLTLADVEYAVQRKKQRLRDLINANNWWGTLAAIAREKQLVRDDACLTVLYHRLVLKYNGTGWYDVTPIVAELPEFELAYKQLPAKS